MTTVSASSLPGSRQALDQAARDGWTVGRIKNDWGNRLLRPPRGERRPRHLGRPRHRPGRAGRGPARSPIPCCAPAWRTFAATASRRPPRSGRAPRRGPDLAPALRPPGRALAARDRGEVTAFAPRGAGALLRRAGFAAVTSCGPGEAGEVAGVRGHRGARRARPAAPAARAARGAARLRARGRRARVLRGDTDLFDGHERDRTGGPRPAARGRLGSRARERGTPGSRVRRPRGGADPPVAWRCRSTGARSTRAGAGSATGSRSRRAASRLTRRSWPPAWRCACWRRESRSPCRRENIPPESGTASRRAPAVRGPALLEGVDVVLRQRPDRGSGARRSPLAHDLAGRGAGRGASPCSPSRS